MIDSRKGKPSIFPVHDIRMRVLQVSFFAVCI